MSEMSRENDWPIAGNSGASVRAVVQEAVLAIDSPAVEAADAASNAPGFGHTATVFDLVRALERRKLQVQDLEASEVGDWIAQRRVAIFVDRESISLVTGASSGRLTEARFRGGLATSGLRSRNYFENKHKESGAWFAVSPALCLSDLSRQSGDSMPPWVRLKNLLRIEARDLWVVMVYAVTIGLLTLATPIATQSLVNSIAFGTVLQPLVVLTIALMIGLGLAATLRGLQSYVVEVLQRRILVRYAEDFALRLPQVSDHARKHYDMVELSNRFYDVITLQKAASTLLLSGLGLALQTIAGTILLGFYHPALLAFSIILWMGIGLVIFSGRGGTETAIAESKSKFAIGAWLEELAKQPGLFSAGHGRAFAAERSAERIHSYVGRRQKHFRHVLRVLFGGLALQVISIVSLLAIGGYLVIERQLTLGQLIAAEIVLTSIAAGVAKLGGLVEKGFDVVAATDKLGKMLDQPLEEEGHEELTYQSEGMLVEARDLSFYSGTEYFGPLSLTLRPGDKLLMPEAYDGEDSALLEFLAGRKPTDGHVLWAGRSNPWREDLAKNLLYLHDKEIFSGSVLDNLRVAKVELSEADAWKVMEQVGLDTAVNSLGGLDAELLGEGYPLSKKELRRLLIARAVIAESPVLLLDGVLDFIGTEEETRELCALVQSLPSQSLLVAAHDPRVRHYFGECIEILSDSLQGDE